MPTDKRVRSCLKRKEIATSVAPAALEALAETYFLAWQSVTAGTSVMGQDPRDDQTADEYEILSAGRYVDHFTKRSSGWRIQERVTVVESTMVVPAPSTGPIRFPEQLGAVPPERERRVDDAATAAPAGLSASELRRSEA